MKSAVCMIVKNEARDVAEWIAYHLAVGFDSVIIFDNLSTDNTAAVIAAFAPFHDVRCIDWPITTAVYQMQAYDHAVAQFRHEFDWICFIDSDEFLVPRRDDGVKTFLEAFTDQAAIAINWAVFGSSGHMRQPDGLIVEQFLRRSENTFSINRHVKSFVRPTQVISSANPHYFNVSGAYVTDSRKAVEWQTPGITAAQPDYEFMQVNHYFVKSLEQWQRKIQRGYHDLERSGAEFAAYDRNEVEDAAALRFLPTTKIILDAAALKPKASLMLS